MDEEPKTDQPELEVIEPIVINLGKQKRKRIKKLLKGRGKLWREVDSVVDEVVELLGDEIEDKTILPLVLVYRKKPKRKRRGMLGF